MGLRTLLLDLAKDRGVKIDVEELDALGLTDDDDRSKIDDTRLDPEIEVLSTQLPGSASGMAEIFLEAPKGKVVKRQGLLWSPIGMENQWAMRPDGKGGKTHAPLKLVAGSSLNQRRQIGMKDIVDNFNDGAVEMVTIPTTHNNGPLENTGYVEKLALVDGKVKGKTVKILMAGERYTDKLAEQKVLEGSTPGRSMGLLYDYQRTDTAKTYSVALEHVALTSKRWLRGMPKLRRPLSAPDEISTVSLALSDEGPSEIDLETMLSEAVSDDDPTDFLAEPVIQWSHEDSPEWLRQQVNDILRVARQEKLSKRKSADVNIYVEESLPHYRCQEAKPGQALIADGYGDGSNFWVAAITVTDGKVSLADFKDWTSTKQVWVADQREQPKGDKEPLADQLKVEVPSTELDGLALAQAMRRAGLGKDPQERIKTDHLHDQDPTTTNPPRGGGEVDGKNDNTLQLSDEARRLIQAADDRAKAAEDEAKKTKDQLAETNKKVDALLATGNVAKAEAFITRLKTPVDAGGLGLSEERGFGGMLAEIEQIMLADDGGPALKSDHFSDEKTNPDGTLTVSEALERVFGALRTAEGSTLKLGEIIEQPITNKDGKSGKPPKDDAPDDMTNLSDDEILAKEDPELLKRAGIKVPANGDGKGAS